MCSVRTPAGTDVPRPHTGRTGSAAAGSGKAVQSTSSVIRGIGTRLAMAGATESTARANRATLNALAMGVLLTLWMYFLTRLLFRQSHPADRG